MGRREMEASKRLDRQALLLAAADESCRQLVAAAVAEAHASTAARLAEAQVRSLPDTRSADELWDAECTWI